jgi:hypothetical protein
MTQNLHEMTTSELKQYISEHRNNEEAFREALQVLLSRQDPNTPRYATTNHGSRLDWEASKPSRSQHTALSLSF